MSATELKQNDQLAIDRTRLAGYRLTVQDVEDAIRRQNAEIPAGRIESEAREQGEKRARKLIWMNPEFPAQWSTGDSDMHAYQPLCSAVYPVRNLQQLTEAIDHMLG